MTTQFPKMPEFALDFCKWAWRHTFPAKIVTEDWMLVFAASGLASATVSMPPRRRLFTFAGDKNTSVLFLVPPGATLRWRFVKECVEIIRFHFHSQELAFDAATGDIRFGCAGIGDIELRQARYLHAYETLRYRPLFQEVAESCFMDNVVERFFATLSFPALLALMTKARYGHFYSMPLGDAGVVKAIFESEIVGRKTIDETARSIGRSAPHVRRAFAKRFGRLPSKYRDDLRLKRALDYIRRTQIPFKEIGTILGMKGRGYLSAYVKRKTGKTPRELRNATIQSAED